jgi:hypothetical protein
VTAAFKAAGAGTITITSGGACTPALPAGTVAGDVLIAHVFYGGSTAAPATPSGWSLLDGPDDLSTPATNGRVWVFGKKAVGGDADPAFGTQAVTTPRRARVYSFNGALDDTIANIVGGYDYGTGTTTPVADTGVTTGADAEDYLAVNLIAGSDDTLAPADFSGETGGNWATPGGATPYTTTTGTPDTWMNLQVAVVAPSTTINGGTGASTANDPWGVNGFYIRSAPPPPGPQLDGSIVEAEANASAATTAARDIPNNRSVWIFVTHNCSTANATDSAVTDNSASITPVLVAKRNTQAGTTAEIWRGYNSSGSTVSGYTVTATGTAFGGASVTRTHIVVVVLSGEEETFGGDSDVASSASGLPSITLTTTRDDSWCWSVKSDWSAGAVGTPGTSQTIVHSYTSADYTSDVWNRTDRVTSGNNVTLNETAPSAQNYNQAAVEIRLAAGGGQTVNAAQVVETETAQAVTLRKTEIAAQVTETETAQPITVRRIETAAQVTETETAQAVTLRETVALGQPVETETAQAITVTVGGGQTIPVTQVVETETAQAVTLRKAETAAQVIEIETARAVTLRKTETAGQVVETETAQPVTLRKTETAGQTVETESSRPVTLRKTIALGQALEAELAQPFTIAGPQTVPFGQTLETESARPVTLRLTRVLGQPAETETARAVVTVRVVSLGQIVEAETAVALGVVGGAPVFTVGAAETSVTPLGAGTVTVSVQGRASAVPVGSGVPSVSGG